MKGFPPVSSALKIVDSLSKSRVDSPPDVPVPAGQPEFPDFAAKTSNRLGLFQLPAAMLAAASKIHPDPGMTGFKHRLKFLGRSLVSPWLTRDWLELWQTPKLLLLRQSHPRVLMKLQRPYLRRGLDAKEHWRILRQHYCFATKYFPAGAFGKIITSTGVRLAENGPFSLRLFYHNIFEKEGELSLLFYDERRKAMVFALSFCVSLCRPGRREIFIGGLQGFKTANEREYVVAVTREFFGLRPKALLVFALQQLAALWDVAAIHAVSNQTRNLRHRPKHIQADYDQFWRESGAALEPDGNFTLPVAFVSRDLASIKPNKRTMYRRRYQMLDKLGEAIRQNLCQLTGQGPCFSRNVCSRCPIAGA
jgi:uncharacterized protein VirK/YbjX